MRCKAILVNKKGIKPLFRRCQHNATFEGYCITHYKKYKMGKKQNGKRKNK